MSVAAPASRRTHAARDSETPRAVEYVRPYLYPKQSAFLFANKRYSIIEASTKTGKTVGCMVWLFEQALLAPTSGRNYWWVAPTGGVAKIAFRRLKRAIPKALYTTNETELTITLANENVLWFKGSDRPDSLYGDDVYAAVIDEATRCKEDAWIAVRSTLTATRGPIRIIGNVKGKKNWAFKLARLAESGTPDMAYFKLTAYDAVDGGVLELAEVEDAKRLLTKEVFDELYLAEPSDDGGNPFGMKAIRAIVAPLSTRPIVCWGWDLAKSYDWTVGVGLDDRGHVAALERWQGPWEATIGKIRHLTAGLDALVDSTGVGDAVLESLQANGGQNFEGFKFTTTSKQQLMEGAVLAVQQGLTRVPEGPLLNELETFEYEYTRTGVRYAAPAGLHDDCVCAFALALQMRSHPRARFMVA